ncbi:MAG TPA: hypothetical protein VN622_01650 [Clostridia bacterium]|nr:hypothetical protein [Clostridia bacterium]
MSEETNSSRVRFENAGRKLDEAAERVEREAEQFIKYLNDEVVPAVRTHSSRALRTAAEKMQQFADYMEQNSPKSE